MVDQIWFKRVLRTLRGKKHSKSAFKLVRRQLDFDPDFPPMGQTTYAKDHSDSTSSASAERSADPESTKL